MTYNPSTLLAEVRDELTQAIIRSGEDPLLADFTMNVDSNKASENYPIVGDAPRLTRFDDVIEIKSMSDALVNLPNLDYGMGIKIKKKELEDDQTGAIKMRVGESTAELDDQKRRIVLESLESGALVYDGVPFFDDAHPARGLAPAFDNNLGISGTTSALVQTDLHLGIEALLAMRDEAGRMVNKSLSKLGIIAPPGFRRQILEAVQAPVTNNTSNVGVSGIDWRIVFSAELVNTGRWYLFNLSGRIKPFLLQSRIAGEMEDEYIKAERAFAFYTTVRNAAMMTRPQLGVRFA